MNKIASDTVTKLPSGRGRTLRSVDELAAAGLIGQSDHEQLGRVAARFSVALTPQVQKLIAAEGADGPCARQFVPDARELEESEADMSDPIGDAAHSPLPGIVHRYHDRLLLMPTRVCPVYCRFCFRRENVGSNAAAMLSADELAAAYRYIEEHQEVWEVILSGGDPLMLSPRRLREIIQRIERIGHVNVIRIHSRVPVADPERINADLIDALKCSKPVYLVLHSNHPSELNQAARSAIANLVDSGIPLLSQTVLLRGINDNIETLEQLMRTFVANRIKPYYLHHADRARGTAHFRTGVEAGQRLMRELRGRVSGLCQPEYVLDIPGGAGKVPVYQARKTEATVAEYELVDYRGRKHRYTDKAGPGME
jgi:lysine 2,3-aminomutase